MLYAIIGIQMGGALTSKDKTTKLAFRTKLSDYIIQNAINIVMSKCSGNILIADLEKSGETLYAGASYQISYEKNFQKIYDEVVSNLIPGREIFTEDKMQPEISREFINSLSKEEISGVFEKYISKIEKAVKKNSIDILITDSVIAANIAKIISSKNKNEELYLIMDESIDAQGNFNLEDWNQWRAYCREMQFNNEFPLTFAGIKEVPFARMDKQSRPRNRSYMFVFNEKKEEVLGSNV